MRAGRGARRERPVARLAVDRRGGGRKIRRETEKAGPIWCMEFSRCKTVRL